MLRLPLTRLDDVKNEDLLILQRDPVIADNGVQEIQTINQTPTQSRHPSTPIPFSLSIATSGNTPHTPQRMLCFSFCFLCLFQPQHNEPLNELVLLLAEFIT